MKSKIKSFVLPGAVSLLFMAIYFYLAIPAINIRSSGLYFMIILTALVYIAVYSAINRTSLFVKVARIISKLNEASSNKNVKKQSNVEYVFDQNGKKVNDVVIGKKTKIALIIVGIVLAVFLIVCIVTSSKIFRAQKYQSMLSVTESDFALDIAEMPLTQIPIVDKGTAERLGSRKIGEVVELVSQFNVATYYSQINYNDKPFRVSPLEYADILKWLSNKDDGIPYYISIDMATQQTELVKLSEGMKYSPSEYFARDLERHIRFAYPTKMFENLSFEVDDNGNPYWVMSYYTYTIGIFGGKDIAGIILVDAVTGETSDYPVSEIPQWIDLAYSPELIIDQANNWGSLVNGFINSIFVQKGVVVTTEGYNYIAVDDDVWLYTGITSVSSDESNIGFILINMRTKQAKTYMINGAEEYSAMDSAEGQIQEKGYEATFPILINVADRPTYFISLKDNAGLVKAYAFVSVADYQIVGVADTIAGANAEYIRMLGIESNPEDNGEAVQVSGSVSAIATAVVNGNSVYYIRIADDIYTADISVSDMLPFLNVGDSVTVTVVNGAIKEITVGE